MAIRLRRNARGEADPELGRAHDGARAVRGQRQPAARRLRVEHCAGAEPDDVRRRRDLRAKNGCADNTVLRMVFVTV